MSKTVIKFENLSKLYRLGEVGTGTISHDLNRWWKMNIQGQPDPYTKIGQTNDRAAKAEKGEVIWALKDIDFEVKEGEVLGIIGNNGAGKSTLLKILSKVTSPTTGCIKVKGRIASLLEVGTGFNPEMTGRENIYMNGTIMGMRKWEIDKKLDEIVEFAGVAKYIDTPVKRYSSGMTVRLGFAVAAHLESEILVVDEVLAVGDAEFQKKALGKMQEVSQGQGRTVLFVSHNMGAIKSLCGISILLKNGKLISIGITKNIIDEYLIINAAESKKITVKGEVLYFKEIELVNFDEKVLTFYLRLESKKPHKNSFLAVDIKSSIGEVITQTIPIIEPFIPYEGLKSYILKIELPQLIPGKYFCDFWVGSHFNETYHYVKDYIQFEIANNPQVSRTYSYFNDHGHFITNSIITYENI